MEPSYELIHTQMKTQEWDNSKVIHVTPLLYLMPLSANYPFAMLAEKALPACFEMKNESNPIPVLKSDQIITYHTKFPTAMVLFPVIFSGGC